jgi:hypothetical protein
LGTTPYRFREPLELTSFDQDSTLTYRIENWSLDIEIGRSLEDCVRHLGILPKRLVELNHPSMELWDPDRAGSVADEGSALVPP